MHRPSGLFVAAQTLNESIIPKVAHELIMQLCINIMIY